MHIKTHGGHAGYAVGRALQAFEPNAMSYTGVADPDRVRDIDSGLIKKANIVAVKGNAAHSEAEVEAKLSKALGSRSVQLVELRFLKVSFGSSMKTLSWLAASAQELASTLKVLKVTECGVKGSIPMELGNFFRLIEADFSSNELGGET